MGPRLPIYILCVVGGFILLIGGLILVAKKKVLVDLPQELSSTLNLLYLAIVADIEFRRRSVKEYRWSRQ